MLGSDNWHVMNISDGNYLWFPYKTKLWEEIMQNKDRIYTFSWTFWSKLLKKAYNYNGKQDGKVFHGKEIIKLDGSGSSCPDLCGNLVKQQKKVTSF